MAETLLQPEVLLGLGLPALAWIANQCSKILKAVDKNTEQQEQTNTHLATLNGKVARAVIDIHELELEAVWIRGRMGEPLKPKPPQD